MRLFAMITAFVGLMLSVAVASAQPASTLSGQMALFNYVFGRAWSCAASVPAMGGKPAHTSNSTATFDVAPNNVLHVRVAGSDFTADQYFGYGDRAKVYWSASSDSTGAASAETSVDGKTYRGSLSMGPMNGTAQDTYAKTDDNHVTIHSVGTLGGQSETTVVTCSR